MSAWCLGSRTGQQSVPERNGRGNVCSPPGYASMTHSGTPRGVFTGPLGDSECNEADISGLVVTVGMCIKAQLGQERCSRQSWGASQRSSLLSP